MRRSFGNDWDDFIRFPNSDYQKVADAYCDGRHRIFVEWMPNGDYFFKIRIIHEFEYGIDREQLFRLIAGAEKQAKKNDRYNHRNDEDLRNYYSY